MTVYKSNISRYTKFMLSFVVFVIVAATIPVFYSDETSAQIIIIAINGSTLLFLYWLYKTTTYSMTESELICKSGPFKKVIGLKTIKKIEHHNGIVVPVIWKMSWDKKGIIITYNTYDDIYISPQNQKVFINKLLQINPNIKITGNA